MVYFLVPGSALNLTLSKNRLGNEGQNYFYRYISTHKGRSIQSKVIFYFSKIIFFLTSSNLSIFKPIYAKHHKNVMLVNS